VAGSFPQAGHFTPRYDVRYNEGNGGKRKVDSPKHIQKLFTMNQQKTSCVFESAHGRVAVQEIEEYSVADGGLYKGERIARFKGSLLGSDEGQRIYIARLDDLIITPAAA
jgi:hypothetical protein